MPMHKIEASYGEGMEKVLTRMGLGIAFGGDADFSGISKAIPFSIGAVIHKAIIETDGGDPVSWRLVQSQSNGSAIFNPRRAAIPTEGNLSPSFR